MRVAFYAPLKPPDHPVPSGDRTMARALQKALAHAGADVRVVSELRSWARVPSDAGLEALRQRAAAERERLLAEFAAGAWRPDVWLTYHPYYKSPDLLGPEISADLGIPYATVEASFSARRASGGWAAWHAANLPALARADVHFVMTERDRAGLSECEAVRGRLVDFPPFIEVGALQSFLVLPKLPSSPRPARCRLVTVAMMRRDVKLESYRFLAQALVRLSRFDDLSKWSLDIVGDGAARRDVEDAFAHELGAQAADLIRWHGALGREEIDKVLAAADLFVWPGFDEGYGLVYLEAQAAGLPVVAQRSGGVPVVVNDRETGILTPEGDEVAYADGIASLMRDDAVRGVMGLGASAFVRHERSVERASERLMAELKPLVR